VKLETLKFIISPKVKVEEFKDEKLNFDLNQEILNNVYDIQLIQKNNDTKFKLED
jgi:hypothetical protein